jgi:hypothetical protein
MITKDTLWQNYEGNVAPLSELESDHLINIIDYANKCDRSDKAEIEKVCLEILNERGVEVNLDEVEQKPHVNNSGELVVVDYTNAKEIKIRK